MAATTSNTYQGMAQFSGGTPVQLIFVRGTKAAQNDTLTVPNLTTIIGAYIDFASGAVETITFATNVLTLTSATTGVVSGLVWGT